MNIASFLTNTVARIPDRLAIRFKGETITFRELNARVDALAHGLSKAGLKPGDFCVLMMPESPNWPISYYALAKVGAVVIPVNPTYRKRELEHIFRDTGARAFMGHGSYLSEAAAVLAEMPQADIRIADGTGLPEGFTPFKDLFMPEAGEYPVFQTKTDDPWIVMYTSGTTGLPKGAVLTHYNLMKDAEVIAAVRYTEPHDVVLSVLPLFHCYGQTHSMNISIYQGLTMLLFEKFNAEEVLKAIEEEESSLLYAVPTMVNRLVDLASERPPKRSGLRFCISGGASLPVEILHRFEKLFNATIYESYGLTECSPTCVENPFGRPTRPGSIGLPIPPFKARIVDEQDRDVPAGEVGELIVSGPGVMKEYLNQPEATTVALRGGWLHTGDLARMDEDGYIYIVDRKKDLIIRGGYNVYPREIEEVLYTIEDILEAAVIGLPHQDLGEEVAAAVVLRGDSKMTAEDIKQYVKERVAPYKYPRVVKVMKELPKTSTGKILKRGITLD
ncbi:MAG: long-chain-fatty-acid--CoA ligase [Desulfomonilia bacterium]|jgi:long-chain acyl-CoA synthetase|uniref:Long-chain-fatty-acid--CoA ligase n=1 Tax=anaerobic digester metagenome TaxID=1263854 RepID=A0A485M011_9ZZZZ